VQEETWREIERAHQQRADALTAAHRERRRPGAPEDQKHHPVEDFLFTYYKLKPSYLRRWHPGPGVVLEGGLERTDWRWYTTTSDGVTFDVNQFRADRMDGLKYIDAILTATASRPGQYGCFGLHEWAMVYKQPQEQVRHNKVPLRLGSAGTDAVVESHRVKCSHYDAFRFFTPDAVARNEVTPTNTTQADFEQPGCLHAGMDTYRWATKLGPLVPGDLLLDAYELARDIRELDMRASPYDLTAWNYAPIAIETPEGKTAYATAQRAFTLRAAPIRARLLDAIHVSLGKIKPR
jgi:hypothetical protein